MKHSLRLMIALLLSLLPGVTLAQAPGTPASLTARSTDGTGNVTLTWAAVTGAASYNIYRGSATAPYASAAGSATTYVDASVPAPGSYTYSVAAVAGGVEGGRASAGINAAAVPSGLSARAGNGAVSLSWSASANAGSYNIYRSTAAGGEGTTVYKTVTSPAYTDSTPNGTYYYKVAAANSVYLSRQSSEVSATPSSSLPSTPVLSGTAGNGQNRLTWGAVSGATSYNLYRASGNATSGREGTTPYKTGVTSPYTDTAVTNNVPDYYTVTAVNGAGEGAASNEVGLLPVAPPAAPGGLSAAPTASGPVTLTWTAPTGSVTGYTLYRGTATGAETSYKTGLSGTSYSDTGTVKGQRYYYKLSATNAGGEGTQSTEASALTYPGAPSGLAAAAGPGAGQASLTWSAPSDPLPPSGYNVYAGTAAGGESGTPLNGSPVTGASYTASGLAAGTAYFIVRSVNASGVSASASNEASAVISATPAAPASLTATAVSATQINLAWPAVSGTGVTYSVFRGAASNQESATALVSGLTSPAYSDSTATGGTVYYYTVKAVNASGAGAASPEASALTFPLPPASAAATSSGTQVTLYWGMSASATGYNIYRGSTTGMEGATPVNASPVVGTGYVDTVPQSGYYYYTIRAINASGVSDPSAEITARPTSPAQTVPDAPLSLAAVPDSGTVTLTWDLIPGSVNNGYLVLRSTNPGGPYQTVAVAQFATYTDTSWLANGKPYFYVVAAFNSAGVSAYSAEAMAMPYAPPAAPAVTPAYGYDSDGLRTWKTANGQTTYFLYNSGRPVCELDGTGGVTATNTWAGSLISRRAGAASTFYTGDLNGNVIQRLDSTGAVLSTYAFDGYGLRAPALAAGDDPYSGFGGLLGNYTDTETGLTLMGQRYYDAGAGRFLNRDPISYQGGTNVYAYALNNPISYADPSGLSPGGAGGGSGYDPSDPFGGDGEGNWDKSLSMRDGHRGMFPGTYQNDLALGMVDGTEKMIVGATLGPAGGYVAEMGITYFTIGVDGLIGAGDVASLEGVEDGSLAEGAASRFSNCFVAGTPVQMADGATEPIEQVKAGDIVVSRDPATGQTEAKQVTATFSRDAEQVLTLTLADSITGRLEEITCTPGHPFYVAGVGFVLAGDLGIGTQIVTRAGPSLRVTGVRWHGEMNGEPAGARVYNFTVEGDHTYFVGVLGEGAWVHNSSPMFRSIITDADNNEVGFGQSGQVPSNTPDWLVELKNEALSKGLIGENPGGCAEFQAIVDSGLSKEGLAGKTITTIRNGTGPNAGKIGTPCPTCAYVLNQIEGIMRTWGPKW